MRKEINHMIEIKLTEDKVNKDIRFDDIINTPAKEDTININDTTNKKLDFLIASFDDSIIIRKNLSNGELVDVLSECIDRIIIDEFIKISPKEKAAGKEEQEILLKEQKAEMLKEIYKRNIDLDYIHSEENIYPMWISNLLLD